MNQQLAQGASPPAGDSGGRRGRVLLIEADPHLRSAMLACVELAGCMAVTIPSPDVATLERCAFELIVWGVAPSSDEGARRRHIADLGRFHKPLVVVDGNLKQAQFDLEAGAAYWLPRPFLPRALVQVIRAALTDPGLRAPTLGEPSRHIRDGP